MIELRQTGEREVKLWLDGQTAGGAVWDWAALRWGREEVRVARLTRLEAAAGDQASLWAYLEFLWTRQQVAAAQLPDGTLRWFHKALERSWQAAGSPLDF